MSMKPHPLLSEVFQRYRECNSYTDFGTALVFNAQSSVETKISFQTYFQRHGRTRFDWTVYRSNKEPVKNILLLDGSKSKHQTRADSETGDYSFQTESLAIAAVSKSTLSVLFDTMSLLSPSAFTSNLSMNTESFIEGSQEVLGEVCLQLVTGIRHPKDFWICISENERYIRRITKADFKSAKFLAERDSIAAAAEELMMSGGKVSYDGILSILQQGDDAKSETSDTPVYCGKQVNTFERVQFDCEIETQLLGGT